VAIATAPTGVTLHNPRTASPTGNPERDAQSRIRGDPAMTILTKIVAVTALAGIALVNGAGAPKAADAP